MKLKKLVNWPINMPSANKNNLIYRALNQMCRELLLAQSSDWAFINAKTMVDYAVLRTKNTWVLPPGDGIMKKQLEERKIAELEKINDIFRSGF